MHLPWFVERSVLDASGCVLTDALGDALLDVCGCVSVGTLGDIVDVCGCSLIDVPFDGDMGGFAVTTGIDSTKWRSSFEWFASMLSDVSNMEAKRSVMSCVPSSESFPEVGGVSSPLAASAVANLSYSFASADSGYSSLYFSSVRASRCTIPSIFLPGYVPSLLSFSVPVYQKSSI